MIEKTFRHTLIFISSHQPDARGRSKRGGYRHQNRNDYYTRATKVITICLAVRNGWQESCNHPFCCHRTRYKGYCGSFISLLKKLYKLIAYALLSLLQNV